MSHAFRLLIVGLMLASPSMSPHLYMELLISIRYQFKCHLMNRRGQFGRRG